MAMALDGEQRAADVREQEALEDAHRQRVTASIAASAALRFERELRQAPEASKGERGALTESEDHTPSAMQHAEQRLATAAAMDVDDGAGVFDLPARRSNAQRQLAEARREEFAQMAQGATSLAGAAVSASHPSPTPNAQSSMPRGPPADAPTTSQLSIEPEELADATSSSLETAAAEARSTGDAEATLQAEVLLATARSAVTWASETAEQDDDSWQLAEALERSEAEATARSLADDMEIARGVEHLSMSAPSNRVRKRRSTTRRRRRGFAQGSPPTKRWHRRCKDRLRSHTRRRG